jgi:hypothetical protein
VLVILATTLLLLLASFLLFYKISKMSDYMIGENLKTKNLKETDIKYKEFEIASL